METMQEQFLKEVDVSFERIGVTEKDEALKHNLLNLVNNKRETKLRRTATEPEEVPKGGI